MGWGLGKKIFCYYSSFAHTRQGVGNFLPENINPRLCTHLIYAFVEITPDGSDLVPFNRNDAGPNGLYTRTLALKKINPELKVLLAVGGWQIGSKPFIPMIRNETIRAKWIKNVVRYLRSNGFDGFDMDWEFPATRGSPPEDKYRFTSLMKGLYEAFALEAKESGKEKLILTLAAASGTYYIDQSYEPKKIINYIDYMLLMTYNYHGQWEKITGHHSGLLAHKNDPKTGEKSQLFQEWSIDYWLDVGLSKDKLVVGIPTYAMTYTLADPAMHGIHSPAVGGGKMGEFTKETGILAYYEICMNRMNKGWKSEWIEDQKVPFTYDGDQWAGYEDRRSITFKANNILKRGLAGAFVWSIEMDDFNGVCGEGPYPLLSTITTILDDTLSKAAARHSAVISSQTASKQSQPKLKPLLQRKTPNRKEQNSVVRGSVEVVESKSDLVAKINPEVKAPVTSPEVKAPVSSPEVKAPVTSPEVKASVSSSNAKASVSSPEAKAAPQKVDKNRVRWWTAPIFRKTPTWRPLNIGKISSDAGAKEGHVKKKVLWRRKGSRTTSTASPQTTNIPMVKPWQGLHWWSGLSSQQKAVKSTSSGDVPRRTGDVMKKVSTPEPVGPSARPSMLAAYMSFIDARTEVCRKNGIGTYADPMSCDHFIICLSGNWMDIPPHVMACPVGTRFDASLRICNYASHVDCQN
ncbi:Endochitinase 1 [Bulinus truncatus]|nr:Endochitinase 1 [Bulinus truncatus]